MVDVISKLAVGLRRALQLLNTPTRPVRVALKTGLFGLLLLLVLFPNPVLLVKQISHFTTPEQCIQSDFPGVEKALRTIDSLAGPRADSAAIVMAVQDYVYAHVKYAYDWHSWGSVDYWPPASEVFNRGVEDCDGRAILAVSLLRARGFTSAHLLGNANHMWAGLDTFEIMGPRADVTFSHESGDTQLAWPGMHALLTSLATAMTVFPGERVLLLMLGLFIVFLHPAVGAVNFLTSLSLLLGGLYLLKDWGGLFHRQIVGADSILLFAGLFCVLLALFLATRKPT